jgi:hypothetical protein
MTLVLFKVDLDVRLQFYLCVQELWGESDRRSRSHGAYYVALTHLCLNVQGRSMQTLRSGFEHQIVRAVCNVLAVIDSLSSSPITFQHIMYEFSSDSESLLQLETRTP